MSARRPFRIGLQAARINDADGWRALARTAEVDGYASLLVPDHLGRLSTFPALMAAAAVTSRLRLGTYVLNQDFRPPAVLAQEAASVHLLSGGRLELGLGAGWAPREYEQTGLVFEPGPVRVARFDEYVQVVKGLLGASEPFSFDGRFFSLSEYPPLPPAATAAPPPILIGGGSPIMLGIAGRLADIISISTRATPDGRYDLRNITRAAVEAKVHAIQAASGERFPLIELNMTIREVRITSDPRAAARQLLADWAASPQRYAHVDRLTEDDVLDSPHMAIGSVDQVVQQLAADRERWGIAYLEISSSDADAFAPVMQRLN